METESGKIDEPLARDRGNRLRMAVVKGGRGALSLWRVREKFERFTLLEVEIREEEAVDRCHGSKPENMTPPRKQRANQAVLAAPLPSAACAAASRAIGTR